MALPQTLTTRPETPALGSRRWLALILLCAANFMVILDSQVVILALPAISTALGLTPEAAQWVLSANLLTFGGLLLLGGRAADLLGRRRVFMIGTALYLVVSIVCGFAWNQEVLIIARALHGVSAAMMTPTALSILTNMFREGTERNRALAGWAGLASLGAVTGLLVGGSLVGLGWQWVFLVNVPVAIAMLVLSPLLLQESSEADMRRTYDVAGALTSTGGLVLLLYAVVVVPTAGWVSAQTLGLLAGAVVLFALFVVVEQRSSAPLVPLRIFRSGNLVGGNLGMLAVGILPFGLSVTISQYAQTVLGMSAAQFGFRQALMPLSAAIGASVGQFFVTRFGFRAVGAVCMALMAVGSLILVQTVVAASWNILTFLGLIIFGAGMGCATVAAAAAALSGVSRGDAGLASGLNTAALQAGGGFGVAIVITVILAYARGNDVGPGFQAGFVACALIAVVGVLVMVGLTRRPRTETEGV